MDAIALALFGLLAVSAHSTGKSRHPGRVLIFGTLLYAGR